MNRGRIHACVCYPATAHGVEFVAGQFTGNVVDLAHDRFHLSQRGQSDAADATLAQPCRRLCGLHGHQFERENHVNRAGEHSALQTNCAATGP